MSAPRAAASLWSKTVRRVTSRLQTRGLLDEITAVVMEHHCTMAEVIEKGRTPRVVAARHAVWRHLKLMGWSYPDIAKHFEVDHSTVLEGVRRSEERANKKKAEAEKTT